ncbi:hypothetical protein [Desulfobacula sp.]|uniref:hypothetical protein n=1 Tax=Desulfobacula sp. TaxID=2593537 RepID=UPI001EC8DA5A|nr:hypothetical protein [Desulfobacula sp.]
MNSKRIKQRANSLITMKDMMALKKKLHDLHALHGKNKKNRGLTPIKITELC